FRHDVTRREQLEADRLAALEMFSGQAGVDETGAQLDRREFDGTKRALQFIHTAQALRYELSSPGFHRGSFSWFPKQPRVLSRTGCSIPNEPRWAGGTRSLNAVGSGCTRPPTSTSPPSLQSTPTMSSGQSAPPYRPSSEPQPWRYRTSLHGSPPTRRFLIPRGSRHSESTGIGRHDLSGAQARRRLHRPGISPLEPSSERPWPATPAYGSSPASPRSHDGRHQG